MKLPLYPYQQQGMIHLAVTGRALLADEMGLGKTVQAIAACQLLKRMQGIKRVLVVATTSLKSEWEEQIAKFCDLTSIIITRLRHERLKQYKQDAFFYITNYEQIMRDHDEISRILAPDVIILDEAQRIKNWRTKTATTIKSLHSSYAFVLTGTPIENRIDDIYSIVQFLDPKFFGPLFRFNREFYQLDAKGKPKGYKNLDVLHKRLKPLLLRRCKSDVEGELPERTVNNYFVGMTEEQSTRYEEAKAEVAKLAAIARQRQLLQKEFERLQKFLAIMRMLCDTPYILDEEYRICPKLDELATIFDELFADESNKIIVFSEWERMLMLVKEHLQDNDVRFAWHTGSVHQKQRRVEISTFKNDPLCRVFLSTDAGSVGLNLQAANVVINLDIPWNPAKLEQRIARAWRKHQKRSVQVINLVSQDTIEHRMLGLLKQKQMLADSVLEIGKLTEMEMPSTRTAIMERLDEILGNTPMPTPNKEKFAQEANAAKSSETPVQRVSQEIIARFAPRLEKLETYSNDNDNNQKILAVLEGDINQPTQQIQRLLNQSNDKEAIQLEVLDKPTYQMLQRLAKMGIISFNNSKAKQLFHSGNNAEDSQRNKQRALAQKERVYMDQAARKQKMAQLLYDGDFYEEAYPPLCDALEKTLQAFAVFTASVPENNDEKVSTTILDKELVAKFGLPQNAIALAAKLRLADTTKTDQQAVQEYLNQCQSIAQYVEEYINNALLERAA